MKTLLLCSAVLIAGCSSGDILRCPPDQRPVKLAKCQSPQVFSRDLLAAAKVNLEYSGKKIADVDAALASKIMQFSSTLTNQTIQYQSLLQALCEQGNSDPCNAPLHDKLVTAIQQSSTQMLEIKQQTEEIKAIADKQKNNASMSELVDNVNKLESTIAKKPEDVVSAVPKSPTKSN